MKGEMLGSYCNCCVVVCIICFILFYVSFVCKCVLPPGDSPIAVNKYIMSYHKGIYEVRRKNKTCPIDFNNQ